MYKPSLRLIAGAASRTATAPASRRYASSTAQFNWEDPLNTANLFTEEEIAIHETARAYCQERMQPRVLGELCLNA